MTLDSPTVVSRPTRVPPAAKLALEFDPERLLADLTRLSEHRWNKQRSYAEDGTVTEAEVDWRCLPLRSVGGNPERTDPGGPGLEEFHDTERLAKAPYLAEVLGRIPAELRAARLLALGPGAESWVHNDTKYGPAWGTARLHAPIITTPGAKLFMEGTLHRWQPGSLWFGDFSRMHKVENTDNVRRVHLVVDTLVSAELMELFPADYLELLDDDEVLINRRPIALTSAELDHHRVRFPLPASFTSWEEVDGEFLRPQQQLDATIDVYDSRLVLGAGDKQLFTLIHIGGEFRFAGWTDERTVQISRTGDTATVTLRSKCGTTVRELVIQAQPLED